MSLAIAIPVAIAYATRKCESYVQTNVQTNEEVTTATLITHPPYRVRAYQTIKVAKDPRRFALAPNGGKA